MSEYKQDRDSYLSYYYYYYQQHTQPTYHNHIQFCLFLPALFLNMFVCHIVYKLTDCKYNNKDIFHQIKRLGVRLNLKHYLIKSTPKLIGIKFGILCS